jgi:hypothetical protein
VPTTTSRCCAAIRGATSAAPARATRNLIEAVVVLGCDSALYTAQEALKNTDCQVIEGMRMIGTTNATMNIRFPMTVDLDKHQVLKNGKVQHETNVDASERTERMAS